MLVAVRLVIRPAASGARFAVDSLQAESPKTIDANASERSMDASYTDCPSYTAPDNLAQREREKKRLHSDGIAPFVTAH